MTDAPTVTKLDDGTIRVELAELQTRRDTTDGWAAADPTLLPGEFGVNTDTLELRVGDGATPWSGLRTLNVQLVYDASESTYSLASGSAPGRAIPTVDPATSKFSDPVVQALVRSIIDDAVPATNVTYSSERIEAVVSARAGHPRSLPDSATIPGTFDSFRSLYNATPATMLPIRSALARGKSGMDLFVLQIDGDSNTEGRAPEILSSWMKTYTNVLIDALAARGYPIAGDGIITPNPQDKRLTVTGTYEAYNYAIWHLGSGGSLTFTGTRPSTVAAVDLLNGFGGNFNISVDSGTPVAWKAATTNDIAHYRVTGLPLAPHTITVSGGDGHVVGIGTTAATGVQVQKTGIPGSSTNDWAYNNGQTSYQAISLDHTPDLTVIMLGTNDAVLTPSNSPTTYKANLGTLIDLKVSKGSKVALMNALPNDSVLDMSGYTTALYELAVEKGVPLLDLQNIIQTWPEGNAQQLFVADPLHGNDAMHALIGNALLPLVGAA